MIRQLAINRGGILKLGALSAAGLGARRSGNEHSATNLPLREVDTGNAVDGKVVFGLGLSSR